MINMVHGPYTAVVSPYDFSYKNIEPSQFFSKTQHHFISHSIINKSDPQSAISNRNQLHVYTFFHFRVHIRDIWSCNSVDARFITMACLSIMLVRKIASSDDSSGQMQMRRRDFSSPGCVLSNDSIECWTERVWVYFTRMHRAETIKYNLMWIVHEKKWSI